MAIVQVPLNPVPAQSVAIVLANQNCVITLRQIGSRQYLSLSINGAVICENVLLVASSPIVQAAYLDFVGELAVIDLTGANEAPAYTGWGNRWQLLFNDAA